MLSACGDGNYAAQKEPDGPRPGPKRQQKANNSVFGDGGLSLTRALDGTLFDSEEQEGGSSLPVNKFIWQASLDTLSFLPLASTDPFTGVIATDWGTSPSNAAERFKVTVYMVRPALEASALKVAVHREVLSEAGLWTAASVSPDTARKLEDAIIVRARQIKIAELEGSSTG